MTRITCKRHDLQGQRSRSQSHVMRLTGVGRKVVHPTGDNAHQFQGQISKVKVTRPTNAHTVNAQYLPKGKPYEVQTWYTDSPRRPASASSAVTSKVKGQGHVMRLTGVGR